jgi:hypothetical protein
LFQAFSISSEFDGVTVINVSLPHCRTGLTYVLHIVFRAFLEHSQLLRAGHFNVVNLCYNFSVIMYVSVTYGSKIFIVSGMLDDFTVEIY